MIKGVHTMFYSSEPGALRAFIRDNLKFPFTDVGEGWLIFDLPEADMGCHPSDPEEGEPPGTHNVSFYCDDIHQTVAELQTRGVEFTGEVADLGYGLVTHFPMPGGVEVQLYQPHYAKKSAGAAVEANAAPSPLAKAEMLIRKPVEEVFESFIDPAITSRFWFSKGSGRLEAGQQVTWHWEMYGFSTQVDVKAVERNKRILIEWEAYEKPTTVEWIFSPREDGSTFVSITNSGFSGDSDQVARQAIESTEGFALVLAGAKALLEHNIALTLVPDRFPDAHVKQ